MAQARGRMRDRQQRFTDRFKFRLPALAEGLHTFLMILRVHQDTLAETLNVTAGMHVGVEAEVDHMFGHAHRRRRFLRKVRGIGMRFLEKVLGGYDMIDQTDTPRFLCVDRLGLNHQFLGLGKTNDMNHRLHAPLAGMHPI